MLAVVERSFARLVADGRVLVDDDVEESFEDLWAARKTLKQRARGGARSLKSRLAAVLSLTYDVERHIIGACLRYGAATNLLIGDVMDTLKSIRLQRIVRPSIRLTSDEVRRIVFDFYVFYNQRELIEHVGADRYFEFRANEHYYRSTILTEIPHIMIEACKYRAKMNI